MRRVVLLFSMLVTFSCSDTTEPAPGSLTWDLPNLRWFLELGDSVRFRAVLVDPSGSPVKADVSWTSSNPAVVTIDNQGLAVARSLGTSVITASNKSAGGMGWTLTVVRPIAALALTPDSVSLVPEGAALLELTPVDASGVPVTDDRSLLDEMRTDTHWAIADTNIAQLGGIASSSTPGLLTARRPGATSVEARLLAHTGTASVTVHALALSSVFAGGVFSCGLTADSLPYCWGGGEPASPWSFPWWAPRHVPSTWEHVPRMGMLSVGGQHVCGLTADGAAYCWGSNEWGALGAGMADQPGEPTPVLGNLRFSTISAGNEFTCAIARTGGVYCWGIAPGVDSIRTPERCGTDGKYSTRIPCARSPLQVGDTALHLVTLSAGGRHICGLDRQGRAYCWGPLGSHSNAVPALVDSSLRFTALASGLSFTCGLDPAGLARCWGMLPGTQNGASDVPVPMASGLSFSTLSAGHVGQPFYQSGGSHVCGLAPDGQGYCWGENASGQLGAPPGPAQLAPVPLRFDGGLRILSAGAYHSCALSVAGVAYCWGSNAFKQLGTRDPTLRWTPAPVAGQRP